MPDEMINFISGDSYVQVEDVERSDQMSCGSDFRFPKHCVNANEVCRDKVIKQCSDKSLSENSICEAPTLTCEEYSSYTSEQRNGVINNVESQRVIQQSNGFSHSNSYTTCEHEIENEDQSSADVFPAVEESSMVSLAIDPSLFDESFEASESEIQNEDRMRKETCVGDSVSPELDHVQTQTLVTEQHHSSETNHSPHSNYYVSRPYASDDHLLGNEVTSPILSDHDDSIPITLINDYRNASSHCDLQPHCNASEEYELSDCDARSHYSETSRAQSPHSISDISELSQMSHETHTGEKPSPSVEDSVCNRRAESPIDFELDITSMSIEGDNPAWSFDHFMVGERNHRHQHSVSDTSFESETFVSVSGQLNRNNCRICGKRFPSRSEAEKHEMRVHISVRFDGEKQHDHHSLSDISSENEMFVSVSGQFNRNNCRTCGKQFPSRHDAEKHEMRVHNSVRYPCNYCDYSSYCTGTMRRHINRHRAKGLRPLRPMAAKLVELGIDGGRPVAGKGSSAVFVDEKGSPALPMNGTGSSSAAVCNDKTDSRFVDFDPPLDDDGRPVFTEKERQPPESQFLAEFHTTRMISAGLNELREPGATKNNSVGCRRITAVPDELREPGATDNSVGCRRRGSRNRENSSLKVRRSIQKRTTSTAKVHSSNNCIDEVAHDKSVDSANDSSDDKSVDSANNSSDDQPHFDLFYAYDVPPSRDIVASVRSITRRVLNALARDNPACSTHSKHPGSKSSTKYRKTARYRKAVFVAHRKRSERFVKRNHCTLYKCLLCPQSDYTFRWMTIREHATNCHLLDLSYVRFGMLKNGDSYKSADLGAVVWENNDGHHLLFDVDSHPAPHSNEYYRPLAITEINSDSSSNLWRDDQDNELPSSSSKESNPWREDQDKEQSAISEDEDNDVGNTSISVLHSDLNLQSRVEENPSRVKNNDTENIPASLLHSDFNLKSGEENPCREKDNDMENTSASVLHSDFNVQSGAEEKPCRESDKHLDEHSSSNVELDHTYSIRFDSHVEMEHDYCLRNDALCMTRLLRPNPIIELEDEL